MKFLVLLFFILSNTVLSSEQALMMKGVEPEGLQEDGQKLTEYLVAINDVLSDFGKAPVDEECFRFIEQDADKISPHTIIYINEWLRFPSLCNSAKNRYKSESVNKCRERSRDNFQKLIPFIEAAADAFDLNPNHLACLLLQESQFLDTAQSGTGPLGLAQISGGTQDTEKAIFSAKLPSACDAKLSIPCTQIRSSAKKAQCRKDARYCLNKQRLVSKKDTLSPRWKEYANYANPNIKDYYHISPDKYCEKSECRKNEYWAVGAAALYIKEIVDYDLGDTALKASNATEHFLMGTALYNPGPGMKDKIIPQNLDLFTQGWEEKIDPKKYDEPRQYVERIRQCIEYQIGLPILKQ